MPWGGGDKNRFIDDEEPVVADERTGSWSAKNRFVDGGCRGERGREAWDDEEIVPEDRALPYWVGGREHVGEGEEDGMPGRTRE